MRVWLLEAGTSPHTMVTAGVFRKQKKAVRVFDKLRMEARTETGLKIQRYTHDDGTHESVWGLNRLRLRPMEVVR